MLTYVFQSVDAAHDEIQKPKRKEDSDALTLESWLLFTER